MIWFYLNIFCLFGYIYLFFYMTFKHKTEDKFLKKMFVFTCLITIIHFAETAGYYLITLGVI